MQWPRVEGAGGGQTLAILAFLAAQRGPVPAATIATALGIPRSSVYHLLAVLEEHGFVVHLPEERRYGLGTAAFELAGGSRGSSRSRASAARSSRGSSTASARPGTSPCCTGVTCSTSSRSARRGRPRS